MPYSLRKTPDLIKKHCVSVTNPASLKSVNLDSPEWIATDYFDLHLAITLWIKWPFLYLAPKRTSVVSNPEGSCFESHLQVISFSLKVDTVVKRAQTVETAIITYELFGLKLCK